MEGKEGGGIRMPTPSNCEVPSSCGEVVPLPVMASKCHPSRHEEENNSMKKGKKPPRKVKSAEDIAAQSFFLHKQKVLQDLSRSCGDRSPKHSVDKKCLSLLELLNTHPDYVTTSSCSGRIAFFHSIEEEEEEVDTTRIRPTSSGVVKKTKRGGAEAQGWLFVKHGMLTPLEMEVLVYYFCGPPNTRGSKLLDERHRREADQCFTMASNAGNMRWYSGEWNGSDPRLLNLLMTHACPSDGLCTSCCTDNDCKDASISSSLSMSSSCSSFSASSSSHEVPLSSSLLPLSPPLLFSRCSLRSFPTPPFVGNVALKMEPFVLHVQCRTIEAGKVLLNAAISDSGYRNSGLIPPGNKVMCAIRTAVGLGMDIPLQLDGHNYVMHRNGKVQTKEKRNGNAIAEPLKETNEEKRFRRHSSTASQGRAYVWKLLCRANQKMKANEEKILLLERSVKHRLAGNGPPSK